MAVEERGVGFGVCLLLFFFFVFFFFFFGGGGGGGRGCSARHQSSSPCSGPPKLNNPSSADHSPHPTWSKILLRNRASSAQSSTKLCISIRPCFQILALVWL